MARGNVDGAFLELPEHLTRPLGLGENSLRGSGQLSKENTVAGMKWVAADGTALVELMASSSLARQRPRFDATLCCHSQPGNVRCGQRLNEGQGAQ